MSDSPGLSPPVEHKLHPKTTDVVPVKVNNRSNDQALGVQFQINNSNDALNTDSAVRTPMSQMLRSSLSSLFLAQFQTVSLMSRMGTAQAAKMVRTFQHPVPPLPVSATQSHHEVGCGIEVTRRI
ncbi:hypothetical protein FOCG_12811 [Fusarium oxysporum f. sp. radicis-lycopersici 26381]|nr:hypothetical protein FOCG_12811 [Fusarium oxysporum f. sp. radicis-lycopersici 26381]